MVDSLPCCTAHPAHSSDNLPCCTAPGPPRLAACRQDQVKAEILAYLKMMGEVYDVFGLDYKMALSTRPEGYLGELEVWNKAEAALEEALNATGREWEVSGGCRAAGSGVVQVQEAGCGSRRGAGRRGKEGGRVVCWGTWRLGWGEWSGGGSDGRGTGPLWRRPVAGTTSAQA